jgi:hypothetical protein
MKKLIAIFVICLLGVMTVFAQDSVDDQGNPNDPAVNERANACYAGAAWEYRCGNDQTLWDAGWYYIRLQRGILSPSELPSSFWWIIPSDGSLGEVPAPAFGVCKEYYILLGVHYYAIFDSPTGDLEGDGDPFWMDDPTCAATAPLIFGGGWKVAFAPGGAAQADALCGATPLRQHSADIFVCTGA